MRADNQMGAMQLQHQVCSSVSFTDEVGEWHAWACCTSGGIYPIVSARLLKHAGRTCVASATGKKSVTGDLRPLIGVGHGPAAELNTSRWHKLLHRSHACRALVSKLPHPFYHAVVDTRTQFQRLCLPHAVLPGAALHVTPNVNPS